MEQIPEIVRLAGDALGSVAIGSYLHGSAVHGGLRPASDLDVLVVTERSLDDPERAALLDGLLAISGSADRGLRPVELVVVVQSEVRPWQFPPRADFLYGEWLRAEFETGGAPEPEPMPDLALLITMVLAGSHPLSGPAPARVLDPVPHADLVRASVGGISGLLEDLDGDVRNVLLTFARIWSTLATGEIRSKDAAAQWAIDRLPPQHRGVLVHAKELYLHCRYSQESWDAEMVAQVPAHVDHVLAEIDRLAPR